jgi:hypothetical protein
MCIYIYIYIYAYVYEAFSTHETIDDRGETPREHCEIGHSHVRAHSSNIQPRCALGAHSEKQRPRRRPL